MPKVNPGGPNNSGPYHLKVGTIIEYAVSKVANRDWVECYSYTNLFIMGNYFNELR